MYACMFYIFMHFCKIGHRLLIGNTIQQLWVPWNQLTENCTLLMDIHELQSTLPTFEDWCE